ncbi:hypothetical protein R1sor_025747 [Riccia sorocarpa]|uniref:Reverse transcriptase domain-containing protein n=1 Tax=Riccia sorocarpa TaxID=122646 RepID=A0ABD3GF39_9MARC
MYVTSRLFGGRSRSTHGGRLARQQIFHLVVRRLEAIESSRLDEVPSDEEIDKTVHSLKKGKAPDLDGVTTDFILECWDVVRPECIQMVRYFWERKSLLLKDTDGCIKLLAKNEDRQWLKNWRPITLMSCTYKIISKLIANRLKKFLPHLIDVEQTGFVQGRRIEDNILTLRTAEEWSKVANEKNLFIKLDFTKAFDRVSFIFI